MTVELWTDNSDSALQLWVTKDHVSYHKFGENQPIGCTTGYPMPRNYFYCRYILFCNYTQGRYYIQISDKYGSYDPVNPLMIYDRHVYFHHKIRASAMDTLNVTIPHNSSATFVLPYDLRQIQVVSITPVSGQQLHGDHNLEVFVESSIPVDSWLVRSLNGDASCALGTPLITIGSTTANITVPECLVANTGDTWNAHVIRTPVTCADGEISVISRFKRERFISSSSNTGGVSASLSTTRATTIYNKWTFTGGITSDQIVYGRLSNYSLTTSHVHMTLTLYKGNHIKVDNTRGVPCDVGCAMSYQVPSTNVVWGDLCWHCGDSTYDTIFAESTVNYQGGDVVNLPFNLVVQDTTWTELTSTWNMQSFPYEEASLAFFTTVHTRVNALRIDVEVLSGIGVEINVYSDNCGYRAPNQTQYWCFKGVRCEVPLPRLSNFGSYYRSDTDQNSPYLSQNLRIVVRGWDATYQIRRLLQTDNCDKLTSTNAPFCSTDAEITKYVYWGEDNSNSYIAKDRNAYEFYVNLTKAFTCGVSDNCQCREQTEDCRRAIKIYACQSIFNPCDSQTGLELMPTYRTCRNVEFYCFRTFLCAGLPDLMCNHSFYLNGISQVDQNDIPVNALDEPTYSNRRGGIIALIILLILFGVSVVCSLLYILYMRTSSMSSVVFDDSKLGEYEAM